MAPLSSGSFWTLKLVMLSRGAMSPAVFCEGALRDWEGFWVERNWWTCLCLTALTW